MEVHVLRDNGSVATVYYTQDVDGTWKPVRVQPAIKSRLELLRVMQRGREAVNVLVRLVWLACN